MATTLVQKVDWSRGPIFQSQDDVAIRAGITQKKLCNLGRTVLGMLIKENTEPRGERRNRKETFFCQAFLAGVLSRGAVRSVCWGGGGGGGGEVKKLVFFFL
jgi:hypothetical protein